MQKDKSGVMETRRIPADENQSADYVSYRAVQHWHGKWSVHFCDYLPADRASERAKSQHLRLEKGVERVQVGEDAFRDFRMTKSLTVRNWLSTAEALKFVQDAETAWGADKIAARQTHEHHFSKYLPAGAATTPSAKPQP